MDLKSIVQEEKALGKNPCMQYRVSSFEEVDKSLFSKKKTDEALLETRQEAIQMFQNDEQGTNIMLHYIAGRIKLELRPHEFNMDLNNTLLSFYDARNWDVVRHLGELIVSKSSNPLAYRILGDVAHEDGDDAKMWRYYERYVSIDNRDKDIIIQVAKHYDETGEKKLAAKFFQRGILRLDVLDDQAKISSVFSAMIANGRTDFPFFFSFASRVQESDAMFALGLYKQILGALNKEKAELDKDKETKVSESRKNLDNIILVLRDILSIRPDEDGMRDALVSCLRQKYSGSSRLGECLKKYNFRKCADIISCLDEFEKEISYSKGTYVYQKATRRVGLIIAIDNDNVTVRYSGTEEPQVIWLESAFNALVPLSNQNIKAIKKGVPAARIKAKIEGEGGAAWLVRTLLYSADNNRCCLKDMKNEVVPQILSEDDWKRIVDQIKAELRRNEYVRTIPGPTEYYELTAYPSTPEEKMLYFFKTAHNFYDKCACLLEGYKSKEIDRDSDSMLEMAEFFSSILEKNTAPSDEILSSCIVLEIVTENGDINVQVVRSFEEEYRKLSIEERVEAFSHMQGVVLKKTFVDRIVKVDRFAADTLVELIPYYITYVPEKLKRLNKGRDYYDYLKKVFEFYRENLQEFVFFMVEVEPEDLKKIGMTVQDLTKTELMALSYASKLPDVAENRKLVKALKKELLELGKAYSLIAAAGDDEKNELKAVILFNEGLDTEEKNGLRKALVNKWPDIAEEKKTEGGKVVRTISGFLCLSSSYDRKQAELKQINTVDMPNILKEINTARELGDLRENSEYQYAKEHKRELERRVAELNRDLNTVRIVTREDVLGDMVGFGTRVLLHDNASDEDISYTFLGRWESNPGEGIIDFNAPLGQNLVNRKVGERVVFSINNRSYDYLIKKIEIVDF